MSDKPASETPMPFPMRLEETLFEKRRIFLYGEINMDVAREISKKLIAMAESDMGDIVMFVNSPGGHVEAGDTIHDVIRFVKPRVKILGTGWVASAGAHIFVAPAKEDRFCLPNTRFLLHQPMGGVRGQAVDIGIEAQEIVKMRKRLNRILSEQTGQSLERIEEDTDRNFWMTAQEALDYGVVGKIIQSIDEL
ncbi:MAG: ATP-dependent Clp protease proteolytic subunit [bacterium]|nr:ATP-dependent Clp protease proteolytic subunit [bacterium]